MLNFENMNKTISIILPIWAILSAIVLGSCSHDEPNISQGEDDIFTDEVEYLQNKLVVLDDDGNIKERVFGRVLDESTPQTVSVGVDDFNEAKEIFASLFSPETEISEDSLKAQFTIGKGRAELNQVKGGDGVIGRADFDVPGLKFVSSMNFVLNSAWPENDNVKGYHTLGSQYQYNGWKGKSRLTKGDEPHTFVCIREYRNGIPALLVGMSNKEYNKPNMLKEERCVTMKDVKIIHQILISNWNYFKAAFNDNDKNLLSENSYYWISKEDLWTMCYPVASLYENRWKDGKGKNHRVLFCKLSTQKQ